MDSYITQYREKVLPQVQKELGIKNRNAVPCLASVHVNVGIGKYMQTHKDVTPFIEHIARITGQRPVVTKARIAISNFKLREGQPTGVVVTLRGKRMLDFVNKLTNVVLPRVRDFRGLPLTSFDGHGNYSLGLKEHMVFPEAPTDDESKTFGLQITIATTATNDVQCKALLTTLGFPFRKPPQKPKSPIS